MASYTITRNLTNVSSNTIKLKVAPESGYTLPNDIEVLNGTLNSWNPTNGELIISDITDTTTVNIVATIPEEPEINYFSIKVNYADPNIGTENEVDVYIGLSKYIANSPGANTDSFCDGTLEYSKDKLTWTSLNTSGEQFISVTNNETVYFRGKGNTFIGNSTYGSSYKTFRMLVPESVDNSFSVSKITVSGDILTLLDYENYPTRYTGAAFAELFNEMRSTLGSSLTDDVKYCAVNEVDASNLILPDFTNDQCYGMMFRNNNIVHMPKLPALEVANEAYRAMFSGTSEVKNVTALPGTKLGNHAYYSMFNSCNLDKLPEAAGIEFGTASYGYMFTGIQTGVYATNAQEIYEPWYLTGSPIDTDSTGVFTQMFLSFNVPDYSSKINGDVVNGGPVFLYVDPSVWTIAKLEDL